MVCYQHNIHVSPQLTSLRLGIEPGTQWLEAQRARCDGSWLQVEMEIPAKPKLDGCFTFHLIATVPACPN